MTARTRVALFPVTAVLACAIAPTPPDPAREDTVGKHHAFKGYELYSWEIEGGDWRYALLLQCS